MRKFHFALICNVLPCELRLFWNSTGVLNRHLADKLPTCYQQSADCWQKIFVKGGKRQSANSWPTVGQLSADCRPTVGRPLAESRPTVSWGAVLHFFLACYQSTLISEMSFFSQWYFPSSGRSTNENL